MDKHSHNRKSKRGLPNTPRVSDKIMEYYEKYGQDRDLEKFMRFYSPASSQESQKTHHKHCADIEMDSCCMRTRSRETVSSTSSCEALAKMPSRPLSVCCVANSKSLPNIDIQGQDREKLEYAAEDVIVDINIEMEGDKEKILSISSENIQTPKKTVKDMKTQTPESVAKTHRRLEWDSLGDVGYKKSMSTSNISILERSLLKEFFKESSVISEPCTTQPGKEMEQQKQIQHKIVECTKTKEIVHSTPPLACSTLVETYREKCVKRGAKPKMVTQSTSSTSLQEKFEKYAQTSLIKAPNVQSREIQCSMSSSNSVIEGTATPSSFEYLSSRSSKSRSSKSSEYIIETKTNRPNAALEHPFIASITDLLMKRKVLCEKNQQKQKQFNNIRELQTKFQAALEENKENQSQSTTASSTATNATAANTTTTSSFSLTKQAPELDLGIQLICSLIDAKSVNGRQKKQLIRDIVKRLTRLEVGETSQSTNGSGAATATTNSNESSSSNKRQNIYDSVRSVSNCSSKTTNDRNKMDLPASAKLSGVLSDMLAHSELGISPISQAKYSQVTIENCSTSKSNANGDGTASAGRASKSQKEDFKLKSSKEKPPKFQLQQVKDHHDQRFPCKTLQSENVLSENNRKVSNPTPTTSNKELQNDLISKKQFKAGNKTAENRTETPTKDYSLPKENKTTKSTQTSKISDSSKSKTSTKSSHSSCTSSSTSTQSLTTQKCNIIHKDLNNSATDAEQPTMREWLNPLTQSEIEYEEKKREEAKRKSESKQTESRRDKPFKKSSKHNCGRVQQLNWIDNEIHRLECLKHLLLKDETSNTERTSTTLSSTDCTTHRHENSMTKESFPTGKLYDTVYSDKSSVLSESAERLVAEIEVILEESNEDVINLKDNLKRTKEHKKEIQIVYEKPKEKSLTNKTKPKFRTIKETIKINEEQLLKDKDSESESEHMPRQQREKIDTPFGSDNSPEKESLRDMVKQRKHDFMEAYKTKKQNHYEALKQQQQKEEFKYLNLPRKASTLQKMPVTAVETNHYSEPHTMPRKYPTYEPTYAYTKQPLPLTPEEDRETKSSTTSSSGHVLYSTAGLVQQIHSNHLQSHKLKDTSDAAPAATTASSSSTTSLFCISSDVSVPMGSQATSSTPTTTHQYDDVAAAAAVAGVGAQTSDSILRSKPIYGPQLLHFLHPQRLTPHFRPYATTTTSTTACIQVKPKGIAYVIEFDDNKNSNSNLNSNSDNPFASTNIKPIKSTSSMYPENNVKSLMSEEPQLTLQEHLEKAKPKFLQHSKERKAILNQLQAMRQERDRKLREIIDNTSLNSLERRLQYLPPPPIQKLRILNTKDMKALTNKRCANLPEVVARKERVQEEKKRHSYRVLRDVFNRRLQKRVRTGKLSLNHSKAVI